jgi:hypothetical protein
MKASSLLKKASGNSSVIDQLTRDPKFEGSNPATAGTKRKWNIISMKSKIR